VLKGHVVQAAKRVIRAHYVCDVAEGFGLTARFPLPEIFGCEYRLNAANEIVGTEKARPRLTGDGGYRNEAAFRGEKRSESVPIAQLTRRSRENLVECVQDGIERCNIGRAGGRTRHGAPLYTSYCIVKNYAPVDANIDRCEFVGYQSLMSWGCPQCDRTFRQVNQRHACGVGDPATLLKGRPPALAHLYRKLETTVKDFGDVEVVTRDRYALFRTTRIFADLTVMKDALRVVIHLGRRADAPCFAKIGKSGNRVSHVAFVRTAKDLRSIGAFLREAFNLAEKESEIPSRTEADP
jgi:hypothetical protein